MLWLRRLHALLVKRGQNSSPQRVYRVYKREGLAVRRLQRKRLTRPAALLPHLYRANQERVLYFASDALAMAEEFDRLLPKQGKKNLR